MQAKFERAAVCGYATSLTAAAATAVHGVLGGHLPSALELSGLCVISLLVGASAAGGVGVRCPAAAVIVGQIGGFLLTAESYSVTYTLSPAHAALVIATGIAVFYAIVGCASAIHQFISALSRQLHTLATIGLPQKVEADQAGYGDSLAHAQQADIGCAPTRAPPQRADLR
ncbi:hypothetical protein [Gordonia sp. IITR100]|uniref:hypothetical protein n=1 Tax=Gordonia sp. IITR100 TaxID=1314686 RepID=UPI0009913714|nr:hypothetical protein [Gordonia sp. IITR100]